MEPARQIETFKEFFDAVYELELLEAIATDKNFFVAEFSKLAEYSPDLAHDLLEDPENVLRTAIIAAEQVATKHQGTDKVLDIEVRFKNLPASSRVAVGNLRAKELKKLIQVRGIVRQKSDVRPQVVSSKFECPSCGSIIPVLQVDSKFREPTRCSCGRKGQFREVSKNLVDAQKIVLEEASDELDGSEQPKRLNIILKKDLVSPLSDRRTNPGSKIEVVGYLNEVPILLPQGQGRSTRFDIMMECLWVEPVEEEFGQISISPAEAEQIKDMSRDPLVYQKLLESVAPSIYGHERVKEALILQMLGGIKKIRPDGVATRGDMHVMLIGDPGSGKSQLLRRVTKVAPKARFVSGKGASAAGLTASVVKDEFLRGYALEAGALVLANKGFCCIDELDKMSPDDRSAFHEALEQQCYHADTELMLADGSTRQIGPYVDALFEKRKSETIQGINCEILPIDKVRVLTAKGGKIVPTTATRVSRHTAPKEFLRLTFSNGRSITVTPEHPVFTYQEGLATTRADAVKEGMLVPAPRHIPVTDSTAELKDFVSHGTTSITEATGAFLGYFASEGHSYRDGTRGNYEIGMCNTDEQALVEMRALSTAIFGNYPNESARAIGGKATKELVTLRVNKKSHYRWFISNFPELAQKARLKHAGILVRTASLVAVQAFLRTAFRGDGFVSETLIGYCTASEQLAKDYQFLLLRTAAYSYLTKENRDQNTYWKVIISGTASMQRIAELLCDDPRISKIKAIISRSLGKNNDRDIVPHTLVRRLALLLRDAHISDGYFHKILERKENCHVETFRKYLTRLESVKTNRPAVTALEAAKQMNVSVGTISNIRANPNHHRGTEYRMLLSAAAELEQKRISKLIEELTTEVNSEFRFVSITRIERVPNTDQKWVYDIQVDETHSFISESLLLHNTVTISKANIQATLRCETVVLAAANPKYGRFDPYEQLAKQIDLPSTLINRFDLIFPIKDKPNKARDEELAHFILTMHRSEGVVEVPYTTEILKKYIAYARQHCVPKLSEEALFEIKKFYVTLRSSGNESEMQSIPISARQLEGLVRLAEASAKSRLSSLITGEDAKRAIDLVYYCLTQIGIDPNTGKLDIDRASGIMPASERNAISQMREIIKQLSEQTGESLIAEEDIMEEARLRGVDLRKAEEALEKLNQKGDIFRPRHGFYSMMK